MNRTVLIGSVLLAVGVFSASSFAAPPLRSLLWTIGAVMLAVAAIACVTARDSRSSAILRLDWFLPQLRRIRPGELPNVRWAGRRIHDWAPKWLLSNHQTKQRGATRRLLRRLGVSWLASPPRRLVQAMCLWAFLFSFFYVCWPYNARPVAPGQVSSGWRFQSIDQQTAELHFVASRRAESWVGQSPALFLQGDSDGPAYGFDVTAVDEQSVTLRSDLQISDELFDELLTREDGWSLHEKRPNAWPSHYADDLAKKEVFAAEFFLVIDPLVSLSTAIASRSWVWSLACAAAIGIVCILVPRGFCGYLCPLGTTIDLFDWAIASRTSAFRVSDDGWWVHIKYYLLAGTLVAASCGILVSGFVAAIPVITRALLFLGEPLQSGAMRGWHLVPGWNWGHAISLALFAVVLCLGFLRPRFWCKYVCPSGAVFSLGNLFRVTQRKVESSCIHCNKCVEICPFDAIKPDFTTRGTDCTMCQSCGGVCPTHAIKFVERWNVVELKVENDPPTRETSIGRRGFVSLAAGTAAATLGGVTAAVATKTFGANLDGQAPVLPVRPPGSVPEQQFLQMCIRCGECFKACPNNVLQPEAFEQGLEGLWTPMVKADWAGCESSCNACGQVCPTGAIRALPLAEKKVARMGLAILNEQTCLPVVGREDCDLCVQECNAAGYHALEYVQVGTEMDENGFPIEGTGMLAPVVLEDKCVGCGLCQTRCFAINVKQRGVLSESAIIIEAGEGREDRMMSGSYIERREREAAARRAAGPAVPQTPPSLPSTPQVEDSENPFGL